MLDPHATLESPTSGSGPDGHPAAPLAVVVVGAGMSGLCMGIQLKRHGIDDFVIWEKSHQVGGTWFENTYPNAGCDVPSFLYSYSFAPKYDWSQKYARQPEILSYFRDCVDRFGIADHLRFGMSVKRAWFDERQSVWHVQSESGETVSARVLVSGVGQLNLPRIPAIEGLEQFQGEQFHSARWNHDIDLSGKRVGVIGNGASAIQFLPGLAEKARETHLFQRSPNWIHPLNNYRYPHWAHWLFRNMPAAAALHRLWIFLVCESRFIGFSKSTLASRIYTGWLKRRLSKEVPEPLRSQLTPDYPAGCKRILLSSDYYSTLMRDDVELVTEPIERFEEQGIRTGQGLKPLDAVIFATGFDANRLLHPIRLEGRQQRDLHEQWDEVPRAYLGMAYPGFPNMFMLYGPNTNLGHNSIIFMVERQVEYILKCLRHMADQNLAELEIKEPEFERYDQKLRKNLSRTVWDGDCTSWYKSADGTIINNWSSTTTAYWWATRQPVFAHFHARPRQDRSSHVDQASSVGAAARDAASRLE